MSKKIKQFKGMTANPPDIKGICDFCCIEKDHLYWTSEGNIIGVTICLDCLEEDPDE